MNTTATLVWFRRDLRLADNPALCEAAESGEVLPLFILDDAEPIGAASRWWLHQSLACLDRTLGGGLRRLRGNPEQQLLQLLQQTGIRRVNWNRVWEPAALAQDARIQTRLEQQGIEVRVFDSSVLWRPDQVLKSDGSPYRVFTPYYRKGCMQQEPPRFPLAEPEQIRLQQGINLSLSLEALQLLPKIHWEDGLARRWQPGEFGARAHLAHFIAKRLSAYQTQRDRPDRDGTSGLSPHLHFGEISPNQIWHLVQQHGAERGLSENHDCFLSELAWREFSAYLLYHWPTLPQRNFRPEFDRFAWQVDNPALKRWQRGLTGVPLVDAGMRELWKTGFMHNRVRMVVASYLVKNLLQDWRMGAAWFADTLVDADLASNSASWQWVAGSGADAAPYFRIFNPVTQGQKFDPDGIYIRRYCPELGRLPSRWIHAPWQAPAEVLSQAGIRLGEHYPHPQIDLGASRQRALAAYAALKESADAFV